MVKGHIGTKKGKKFSYDLNTLTRHAAVLGTTGSGKTVMCKVLVEEALLQGIPVIAIDPKGDIGGLGINNEKFDFRPYVSNPKKVAETQIKNLAEQGVDLTLAKKFKNTTTKIYTPKSSVGLQVSLIPKLEAPDKFKRKNRERPDIDSRIRRTC